MSLVAARLACLVMYACVYGFRRRDSLKYAEAYSYTTTPDNMKCVLFKNKNLHKMCPVMTNAAETAAKTFSTYTKVLDKSTVPQKIKNTEYAVRGQVVIHSLEVEKRLKENPSSYPFQSLLPANIGNPQAVGQKPLSYNRQLLAHLLDPSMITNPPAGTPKDVIERAKKYNAAFKTGAYTHSKGVACLREEVAQWFKHRDGFTVDPENIYLTDGASSGIRLLLEFLIRDSNDAVMIPIPQYPLYSATITRLGGTIVGYYLKEEKNWGFEIESLAKSLKEARSNGKNVRALVVINPGNPTGSILTRQELESIVKFCEAESLLIMADEVYQENIYGDRPFVSMRKVVKEMNSNVELASYHSASKGVAGECGLRGGIMCLDNFDDYVLTEMYKLASSALCGNTVGQAVMTAIVNPPKEGMESYNTYMQERNEIFNSLKRKADLMFKTLNTFPGISCQPALGAMYVFPRINIPQKAIDKAKQKNMSADMDYCLQLLDNTGIIAVPGSGFGQEEGTYHIRLTILPKEEELPAVLEKFKVFHTKYMSDNA